MLWYLYHICTHPITFHGNFTTNAVLLFRQVYSFPFYSLLIYVFKVLIAHFIYKYLVHVEAHICTPRELARNCRSATERFDTR